MGGRNGVGAADVRHVQKRARDSTSGTRLQLGGAEHGRVRGLLHDDQDVKSQVVPSVARSVGKREALVRLSL